jgi:hypothetical protein
MPGMNTGHQATNAGIVAAFHSTLATQLLIAIAVLVALSLAWTLVRSTMQGGSGGPGGSPGERGADPEPVARRFVRIAFGILWVFDGILQAQPEMPVGLPSQVIAPAAASSPVWLQHLVSWGELVWNVHPAEAAASAVWIQVGIGLWLLVAPRGRWSRAGGLASAGWGLAVWIFGESLGGILSPGASWLNGAPGSVLFYVWAGVLLALPDRVWVGAWLGRTILRLMGLLFLALAVVQALPSSGFWRGQGGSLSTMVREMAQTPQPRFLAGVLSDFAGFSASHAVAVNVVTVVTLAAIGLAFLSGRSRLVLPAILTALLLGLADWVLVQDLGFLGGTGTDPNSAIPMAVIYVAGYLAIRRAPGSEVPFRPPVVRWGDVSTGYLLRVFAATGAVAITLLGVVPMLAGAVEVVAGER